MAISKSTVNKLLLFYFLLFSSISNASTNTTLTCKLDIEKTYNNGYIQNTQKDVLIEITEANNQIFIVPKSDLWSVSTTPNSASDHVHYLEIRLEI